MQVNPVFWLRHRILLLIRLLRTPPTPDRRGFFGALGVLVSAAALPADRKPIRLNRFYIAGMQYYGGKRLPLTPGDLINAVREPHNPFDANAIALYAGTTRLGYVPRRENSVLAPMMDHNVALTFAVEHFDGEAPEWERVRVLVEMG